MPKPSNGGQSAPQNASDISDEDCDSNLVNSPYLRTVIRQALRYRERIRTAINRPEGSAASVTLQEIERQSTLCVKQVCRVAINIDKAKLLAADSQGGADEGGNPVNGADEPTLSSSTVNDGSLLDPVGQAGVTQNIALTDGMFDTALLQFEETLSILGLICSLILFLDGHDIDAAKARHMTESLISQTALLEQTQAIFTGTVSVTQA